MELYGIIAVWRCVQKNWCQCELQPPVVLEVQASILCYFVYNHHVILSGNNEITLRYSPDPVLVWKYHWSTGKILIKKPSHLKDGMSYESFHLRATNLPLELNHQIFLFPQHPTVCKQWCEQSAYLHFKHISHIVSVHGRSFRSWLWKLFCFIGCFKRPLGNLANLIVGMI